MIDFVRNYRDMKKLNLDPSDHFFHCKANYEATKRGQEGLNMASKFGVLRETWDQITKGDSGQSSIADFLANYRGQRGALNGKTLKETCPTFYKDYEKW